MTKPKIFMSLAAAAALSVCCYTVPAQAQETQEQAAANLRKPDPKEMDPTYTKAAPFAQKPSLRRSGRGAAAARTWADGELPRL